MKGHITDQLPAIIENGEPDPYPLPPVIGGEPPQQSGAIVWLFRALFVVVASLAIVIVFLAVCP